jgi:hypothetical protein
MKVVAATYASIPDLVLTVGVEAGLGRRLHDICVDAMAGCVNGDVSR